MAKPKSSAAAPAWAANHPRLAQSLTESRRTDLFSDAQCARLIPLIEARFPGLEIVSLQYWRAYRICEGEPVQPERTRFGYSWSEPAMLAEGLVKSESVPPRPKRVRYGGPGEQTVYREKGGRLRTTVEVYDSVDPEHPLAFLRPSAVRGKYDDDTRDGLLHELWEDGRMLEHMMLTRARGEGAWLRQAWIVDPDDVPKLKAAIERARNDLAKALEGLRLQDRRRAQLRLVVHGGGRL